MSENSTVRQDIDLDLYEMPHKLSLSENYTGLIGLIHSRTS